MSVERIPSCPLPGASSWACSWRGSSPGHHHDHDGVLVFMMIMIMMIMMVMILMIMIMMVMIIMMKYKLTNLSSTCLWLHTTLVLHLNPVEKRHLKFDQFDRWKYLYSSSTFEHFLLHYSKHIFPKKNELFSQVRWSFNLNDLSWKTEIIDKRITSQVSHSHPHPPD